MPIYEYECEDCGEVFEELILRKDPDPDACPECGGGGLQRLISNTSFKLEGSGWYVTDYKSKSTKKPDEAPPQPEPSDSASPEDSSPDSDASASSDAA